MTALAGRIVVITGGASGLGRLMALRMVAKGATVVAWDLDEAALDGLVDEIARRGGRAHGHVVNVADAGAVADAADRVRAEVGDPTVLVNNAGVVSGRPLLELDEADIRRTFEVNTLALYWTTQAFLPAMVAADDGHVVTLASAAGLVGVARQSDYSASKHAAVGFDESLRVELRRTSPGVRTTVVCPYYIDTGMFDGVRTRFSWLLPILDPDVVTDRIVAAVERDRAQLILPPAVRLLAPLRVLPPRVFDRVMDLLGVNVSMEHFVGRR